jgi:hypothetical protein
MSQMLIEVVLVSILSKPQGPGHAPGGKGGNEMTKESVVKYLQDELADLRKESEKMQEEYNAADHMTRIGMATKLDKIQDKYYHFWMVCNDLGLTD